MVQSRATKNALHDLGYKIFLDRYAQKDMTRNTLEIGDTVIVVVNPQTGQREVGEITALDLPKVTIKLLDGETVSRDIEHVDKPIETQPEQMMARVAAGVAETEKTDKKRDEWSSKFRWLLDDWKFVPGGRILTAAGTDQELTFYNCYVIPSPNDSREGIMNTLTQMTEIMSRGGGVGINISTLRPRHAYVKGVNGRSSGSVSWGALYSFVTGLIEQGGSRRGALMLILNDWHPDVFDFINSKRQAGQITNANISVGVSDKLMEAVKADGDWELVFPDTNDPDYDELWDGDLNTWVAAGRKVIPYKTIKARELWDSIIESAWASAEPGVWFNERSNKMANSWYFNPLISTNPCITGDMRIHTDEGLVKAQELFDEETEISVAIDGRFGLEQHVTPATRVFMTGIKPVYRMQTKEGYHLRATADHKIMTSRGWVELQDLNQSDKVHILNRKGGFGREGSERLGRILGWLVGDGTIKADRAVLSFFGEEKKELAPMFAEYVNDIVEPLGVNPNRTYAVGVVDIKDRDEARVQSERLRTLVEEYGLVENKHQVPEVVFKGTEGMQRGFLQALFTADGSVQYFKGNKTASVRLACNQIDLLESVQMILANFGIASRIYQERRQAGYRNMPDGKGGLKEYWCEAQHELVISRANMVTFRDEIGFVLDRKQDQLNDMLADYVQGPRAESFVARVESVTEDGYEEVFDLTEPLSHSFVSQSIVISNCGEQPLGAFSVCNLGAVNLSRFYDEDKNDVKWDELRQTVQYATRFLDNVIDTTPYFFKENEVVQMDERRVGLGTMGIAELMVRMGIRYGSDESVDFIDRVYKLITVTAYETSSAIAKEKGAFPRFDAEKFLESGFMQEMPEELRETIRQDGIRNVTLLTQAPTGTTGTMVNTSTGVEPFFSWVYYRKSRLGLHEEKVPVAKEWFDANPDADELPDYFATAMDLAPKDHVRVQGAFQKWIDSAISKTCNVPNEYTVEQVSELYQYMYELGCKGGTIYRDGSRDEQVLMLKGDERAESEMDDIKGKDKDDTPKKEVVAQVATTPHRVYPRPDRLEGTTVRTQTPFGKAYITINKDENGYPFEVFITIGKVGSDIQADADGLGRMISLQLRTTAPHNRNDMLKLIIEQLQDIGGARPIGFGPKRVLSLPDAVASALYDEFFKEEQPQQLNLPMNGDAEEETAETSNVVANTSLSGADMCPDCGTISLIRTEGCRKCLTCGYSEC
jgi:ribonucleoside-diphosphate reductase alpha chain